MEIKEMVDRIEAYCKSMPDCLTCKLNDESANITCYERYSEYPEEIKRNYKKIFGDDESDNVNHPAHYQGKNECINVMIAMFGEEAVKHFCMCNAYKYRFRADKKNGAEDIEKAEWYESKLIKLGGVNDGKID